jgi:phage baseplate assembly protein W
MELYIKYPSDPNYDVDQVQTNGEIEMLITQIQTILFTNRGEIMGDSNFGCNLEDLIYSYTANEHDIRATIGQQLTTYCPLANKYHVDVKVEFMKGEVRDIAFIDITIDSKYAIKISML